MSELFRKLMDARQGTGSFPLPRCDTLNVKLRYAIYLDELNQLVNRIKSLEDAMNEIIANEPNTIHNGNTNDLIACRSHAIAMAAMKDR